jgi:hypothetical protein
MRGGRQYAEDQSRRSDEIGHCSSSEKNETAAFQDSMKYRRRLRDNIATANRNREKLQLIHR